jgi:hypothetical protein
MLRRARLAAFGFHPNGCVARDIRRIRLETKGDRFMITRLGFFLAVTAFAAGASATVHSNRLVGRIETPDMTRACIFFSLQGVTEADPIASGNPWFTVPANHPGFKEIYATLLAARATGSLISVYTTGTVAATCSGHAIADLVILEP